MASAVDICNIALANASQRVVISSLVPATNPLAASCAVFYPHARKLVLEARDWTFATRRGTLASLTSVPSGNWQYAYSPPADCVRIIRAFPEGATTDEETLDFAFESGVLMTNYPAGEIKYVADETDTTRFSGLFIDCLAWKITSFLSGPLGNDANLRELAESRYLMALSFAATADANQTNYKPKPAASWIKNR